MNVEIIREALTLARAVIWESVTMHPEFDEITNSEDAGDVEALELAEELSGHYGDCEALVAVQNALHELAAPKEQQGEAKSEASEAKP